MSILIVHWLTDHFRRGSVNAAIITNVTNLTNLTNVTIVTIVTNVTNLANLTIIQNDCPLTD